MNQSEQSIRRIVDELQQLPEEYLESVYTIVSTLRANLPANTTQKESPQPEQSPFIDETERVREQTRDIPGRREDQYFT